jgi:hypothetical protein
MTKHRDLIQDEELAGLPGADMVLAGLKELHEGEPGEYGLLVLIASPRLTRLGLRIPSRNDIARPLGHQLYARLELTHEEAAYSHYNSLLRRMASFSHSLEQRINQA